MHYLYRVTQSTTQLLGKYHSCREAQETKWALIADKGFAQDSLVIGHYICKYCGSMSSNESNECDGCLIEMADQLSREQDN